VIVILYYINYELWTGEKRALDWDHAGCKNSTSSSQRAHIWCQYCPSSRI